MKMLYRQASVDCQTILGNHRMVWHEFTNAEREALNVPILICVHGLTRVGMDFADLAKVLIRSHRVICPDIVGRGHSDWLDEKHEGTLYQPQTYIADLIRLVQGFAAGSTIDWLGTSMGAILGLIYQQMSIHDDRLPKIRKLILNDIGVRIPHSALARIAQYIGQNPSWNSIEEARAHYQKTYQDFGINGEESWRTFTLHSIRYREGQYRQHYDPRIAQNFVRVSSEDADLTPLFANLQLPTLILRGEYSDVLPAAVFAQTINQPNIQGKVFTGCGHAPALQNAAQINEVDVFLNT